MLTIRKDQVAVLEENMRKSFEENAIKQLKEKYPEQTKGRNEEEMLGFVREGIEQAAGYNIAEREDVFSFLEYMTCFGKDFYSDPANEWAANVLSMKDLTGNEKMNLLKERKPLASELD